MQGSADCSTVAEVPETRFAETPSGRIAYQVVGDGPIDVLVHHLPLFPIDLMWDEPSLVRFLDRLSSFSRHVWFDPRGRGASDRLPRVEEGFRFAETIADDMLALIDHLGLEQVAVVGDTPPVILFAAAHPERTKALVLVNAGARNLQARAALPNDEGVLLELFRRNWGTGALLDLLAPSVAGDARLRRWLGRCQRLQYTPDEAFRRLQAASAMDLRPALASVQVPTLFVWRRGIATAAEFRDDAQHVRGRS